MQRKPTPQSRGPNALEKQHIAWIKERSTCAACGTYAPVIAHHCMGATYKVTVDFERLQIGHLFVIGLCQLCDDIVTHGSRKKFTDYHGPQCEIWAIQAADCPLPIPEKYHIGIMQCGQ